VDIWSSSALLPGILIGVGYGCLYVFGTMIYLDAREYTFCVPVNRASSILAGIAATVVLHFALGYNLPSSYQVAGALLLISAIIVLGIPTWRQSASAVQPMQRLFLFVCGGNRLRSPMAQAICRQQLGTMLGISAEELAARGIRVESAGLSATPGSQMKPHGDQALRSLDLVPHDHRSRSLTPELIAEAEQIFCMTGDQRQEILNMAGNAKIRIHCLDESADLEEPENHEEAVAFGRRLENLIREKFAGFSLENNLLQT
jgi:protein-tyrosine-phosphatase